MCLGVFHFRCWSTWTYPYVAFRKLSEAAPFLFEVNDVPAVLFCRTHVKINHLYFLMQPVHSLTSVTRVTRDDASRLFLNSQRKLFERTEGVSLLLLVTSYPLESS